jgi:hypothetical protein
MTDLKEHFQRYLTAAHQMNHDEAIRQEAQNLYPHFTALAASLNQYQNDKQPPYQPSDFAAMFTAIARENGSLIRSSFVVTDAPSFIEYAQNDCALYYNGEGDTCYPPAASLDSRQKMGFAQLLRMGSDTRITQPILSLNDAYIHDLDAPNTRRLIAGIERLYSLTTHDWLHHLTMYVVGNNQVVKTNKFAQIKDPLIAWNKAMDLPNASYLQSGYEAWAVLTHAQLLDHSAPLKGAITHSVDDFVHIAQTRSAEIAALDDEDAQGAAYQELAYLFHHGATSLRYVAHPSAPVFTPVYTAFDGLMQNEELRIAMAEILGSEGAVRSSDDYRAQLITSNTVTALFEDTPSAVSHRAKINAYTEDVFDMLRTHYTPSSL